jgi:hypothetical protein
MQQFVDASKQHVFFTFSHATRKKRRRRGPAVLDDRLVVCVWLNFHNGSLFPARVAQHLMVALVPFVVVLRAERQPAVRAPKNVRAACLSVRHSFFSSKAQRVTGSHRSRQRTKNTLRACVYCVLLTRGVGQDRRMQGSNSTRERGRGWTRDNGCGGRCTWNCRASLAGVERMQRHRGVHSRGRLLVVHLQLTWRGVLACTAWFQSASGAYPLNKGGALLCVLVDLETKQPARVIEIRHERLHAKHTRNTLVVPQVIFPELFCKEPLSAVLADVPRSISLGHCLCLVLLGVQTLSKRKMIEKNNVLCFQSTKKLEKI